MLLLGTVWALISIIVATSVESPKEAAPITSYDPAELLTKIFNTNKTIISSRQRGYGLVFEDQSDHETNPDENQDHYGLYPFEEDNKRIKFEDDDDSLNYENSNRPLRFQDDSFQNDDGTPVRPLEENQKIRDQVTFQDDNTIDQGKKRKRRRRRKPKNGLQNHQGNPQNYQTGPQNYQGAPQNYQGPPDFQGVPSRPGYPEPGFVPNPNVNSGFPRPFRRRRRPRPSLASDALTAVTGTLTSIALYDDFQCVPRLLCEAAGGGNLGSNGVLDSISGIQPLLTLLSVYNGISSSPLFVFGRAVFLGMTSRGNTGTCRYAYPQCPTDPEQLIHYLNNHNGGFFRFFNAPLPNQNLEQFYNHLGQDGQFNFGQDLGQNGQGYQGQDYGQNQQHFQQNQGNYGLYQNQQSGQGYGFQNNHIGNQRPSTYGGNYGSNYDYNTYGSNVRFKDSNAKIQKRIQNKPIKNDVDENLEQDNDNNDSKWQFPDETTSNTYNEGQNDLYSSADYDKDGDTLTFPEQSQTYDGNRDSKRKGKSILFPENQYNQNAYSNKQYVNTDYQYNGNRVQTEIPHYQNYRTTTDQPYYQNNYYHQPVGTGNIYKPTTAKPFNENDYYYDHKHNFYVKKNTNQENYSNNYNRYQNQVSNNNFYYNKDRNEVNNANYNYYVNSKTKDDGTQTVYIVRGNGDPNRPEIVKVGIGQTVH